MAYSSAPTFSTYQNKRVPFIQNENLRSANTTKDIKLINVFGESIETDITGSKFQTIRKRGGLVEQFFFGNTIDPRGFHETDWKGSWYFVRGNEVHKYERDSHTDTILFHLETSTGPVGFVAYSSTSNDWLFLCDGVQGYLIGPGGDVHGIIPSQWAPNFGYGIGDIVRPTTDTGWWFTCTQAGTSGGTEPDWPTAPDTTVNDNDVVWSSIGGNFPVPHIPMPVYIDGYLILAKAGTQDFYNSEVDDPFNWPLDGFLSAEMYPDNLVAMAKYNNYIVAGGEDSVEFFYDAGIADGSPFQRNESAIQTIGVAAPESLLQTDKQLMFIGQTADGGLTVWKVTDFKAEEIGTPPVRESLTAKGVDITLTKCYMLRHKGHKFYVIRLPDKTWAYDFETDLWSEWTYNGQNWTGWYASNAGSGGSFILTQTNLFILNNDATSDDGVPIACEWRTDILDFDSLNRKAIIRLGVIGDMPFNGVIGVSWSDDDYATWSPVRNIDCSLQRPAIVNLGICRRRAFKFTFTGDLDLRLISMEMVFNIYTS